MPFTVTSSTPGFYFGTAALGDFLGLIQETKQHIWFLTSGFTPQTFLASETNEEKATDCTLLLKQTSSFCRYRYYGHGGF